MTTKTLLFVDDDLRALQHIESIVSDSSTKAHYARSGEEALCLLRATPCAVLVTDLIMPGMNGYELSIAALKEFPDMKIFLATELASPEICHIALEVGIARVFSKPWTDHRIRRMLRATIECSPALRGGVPARFSAHAAEGRGEGYQRK